MHVGRWFSLLLGLITLLFAYAIARLALPGSRWLPLLVLLTVAAIPQFQFISATVSNDNLAIALSTATLFWLARLLVHADKPVGKPIIWHEWLVLGVLLGLAALSKLHTLGLFLLSGGAVLGLAWLRRDQLAADSRRAADSHPCVADCRLVVLAQLHTLWRVVGGQPASHNQRSACRTPHPGLFGG